MPDRAPREGQTERWQPISPTLAAALTAHFGERGDANPDSQILRYRNGRAVGERRYDNLWNRIRSHLPWAATHQISAHWLRHTALTWVERHARSNRNAAMLQLAAELPAVVIADLLGVHTGTATKWAHEANGNWATYAADRSR